MNTCVECGPTDRRIHGHGKCVNCYQRPLNRLRDRSKDPSRSAPRLPVEPLVEFFERNEHLIEGHRRTDIRDALGRQEEKGILVYLADRILVGDFSIHPSEVYGQAWWVA